jgi:hypothetical protein
MNAHRGAEGKINHLKRERKTVVKSKPIIPLSS